MTANLSSSKRDNPTGNTSLSLPVSEMRGLADVLQTTVQNVGALLEVEGCSVALLDTEHNKLVTLATFQKQGRISLITQFQEIHDVASWVAEHREALVEQRECSFREVARLDACDLSGDGFQRDQDRHSRLPASGQWISGG